MRAYVTAVLLLLAVAVSASEGKKEVGVVHGRIESSVGLYMDDAATGYVPAYRFGTNTYVNVGYDVRKFRFGLQYDIYEKPMLGYDPLLEGNGLRGGFVRWTDNVWDVAAGTFMEQFGSGLILRAYEQRDMGVNTSLLGAQVHCTPLPWIHAKFIAGVPRRFMKFVPSGIYGADVEVSVLEPFLPQTDAFLQFGVSWVLRDDMTKERPDAPDVVNAVSARMDFSTGAFSFGGEYVYRTPSYSIDPQLGLDFLGIRKGQALLLDARLDFPRFSASFTWRSIENMGWRQDDSSEQSINLNFIPALAGQHRFALFSLYPHKVHDYGGETGGSIDFTGSMYIGGSRRRPLRWSGGASVFFNMPYRDAAYGFMCVSDDILFAEAYLEAEKRFGRSWKAVLAAGWQRKPEFSRFGFGTPVMNQITAAAEVLWNITSKYSLRGEVQHAWSDFTDDQGWFMGLLEFGMAPGFMLYASDMCNYRTYAATNTHYYDVGVSYAWRFLRASVSYGRHRAGETCSGGICRYVPEYTGVNFSLVMTLHQPLYKNLNKSKHHEN